MRRAIGILEVAALFSVISVCGVVIWDVALRDGRGASAGSAPAAPGRRRTPPPPPLPKTPVALTGTQSRGSPTAHIGVLEFSDFQCPFCATFATTQMPDIVRDYVDSGRVLLSFHHLPLTALHPRAEAAAAAAECAGAQGKFWEMHDILFANPKALAVDDLNQRARDLQLDLGQFSGCLGKGASLGQSRGQALAAELRITGTPTFLVGRLESDHRLTVTRRIAGANGAEIRQELDRLLGDSATQR